MRCRKARWFLSARCDGTLSERQRARLDEHVEHCADCRREAFYFSAIAATASRLERVSVRPDFNIRLRATIRRAETSRSPWRPWYYFVLTSAWRPAFAAAALVALFAIGFGGYRVFLASQQHVPTASEEASEQGPRPTQNRAAAVRPADLTFPPGWTPVIGLSVDAKRLQERYLAASRQPSDFVLETVRLNDPTAQAPEPLYVMPVVRSDQVVRRVSY